MPQTRTHEKQPAESETGSDDLRQVKSLLEAATEP
ncbi:MAG: hypothetical protein J07HB67_00808 [halophilic archaeon J07HB67]|nr:MAG: hypothetical protein J07HB67_00808 [halophilic archaeon J07HB67]